MKQPDLVLAKFVDEHGPAAKISKRVQLEAEVGRCRTIEAACGGGPEMAELLELTVKKRATAEAALANMAKDTPSQMSERKALEETLASFELAAQARLDREQRGAAKAAERRTSRKRHLEALEAEFVILKQEVAKLEGENDARYKERAALATQSDEQVRALVKQKLAALQAVAALPTALPGGAGPSTVAAIPTLALAVVGEAAPPPGEVDHMQILSEQRARIAELELQVQRASTVSITEYEKRFDDVTPDLLPALDLPGPADAVAYGALLTTLQNWSWAGATSAFQWQALKTTAGSVEKAMEIVRTATGSQWSRFYPDMPGELDVVPRQLAQFALHSLTKLQIVFADAQEQQKSVALGMEGVQALRDSCKRLRTDM